MLLGGLVRLAFPSTGEREEQKLNMNELMRKIQRRWEENQMESTHNCRRCGRELKDEESIRLGIGPICLQKEKEKLPVRHGLDLWDLVYGREMDAS